MKLNKIRIPFVNVPGGPLTFKVLDEDFELDKVSIVGEGVWGKEETENGSEEREFTSIIFKQLLILSQLWIYFLCWFFLLIIIHILTNNIQLIIPFTLLKIIMLLFFISICC